MTYGDLVSRLTRSGNLVDRITFSDSEGDVCTIVDDSGLQLAIEEMTDGVS
jgi:hypothetical protein